MNLIEQLGGYGAVKKMWVDGGSLEGTQLAFELLEYRREHNIFEKGDWVVNTKTRAFGEFVIFIDANRGHKHCFVDIGLCDAALFCTKNIRHATPSEIEAGKRLN